MAAIIVMTNNMLNSTFMISNIEKNDILPLQLFSKNNCSITNHKCLHFPLHMQRSCKYSLLWCKALCIRR